MVWWDAGIYRLEEGQRTLVLSTATDALVRCAIDLREDHFVVTDPDGCQFAYRRAPATT